MQAMWRRHHVRLFVKLLLLGGLTLLEPQVEAHLVPVVALGRTQLGRVYRLSALVALFHDDGRLHKQTNNERTNDPTKATLANLLERE